MNSIAIAGYEKENSITLTTYMPHRSCTAHIVILIFLAKNNYDNWISRIHYIYRGHVECNFNSILVDGLH